MTTSLRLRLLPVLGVLLFAVLGVAGTAAAGQPSDAGLALPNCLLGQDTGRICKVSPVQSARPWQAKTGQWIVIRFGEIDPHQAYCLAGQATIVATITLDGKQLPVDTFPCQATVDANGNTEWLVDYRTLVHPLPPGVYSITVSAYFPIALGAGDDYNPAGSVQTSSTTLTVVP